MINKELSHIAFVHYREVGVKGNRENVNGVMDDAASQKNEEVISNSNTKVDSSAASVVQPYDYQRASPVTHTTGGLNTTQSSEHEEAEALKDITFGNQASPGFQSHHELQTPAMQKMDVDSVPTSNNYQGQSSSIPAMTFRSIQGEESKTAMDNHSSSMSPTFEQEFGSHEMQDSVEVAMQEGLKRQDNSEIYSELPDITDINGLAPPLSQDQLYSISDFLQREGRPMNTNERVRKKQIRDCIYASELQSSHIPSLSVEVAMQEGLKRQDNIEIYSELPDIIDINVLGPTLSQDQLYSISDFSPNCAYSGFFS